MPDRIFSNLPFRRLLAGVTLALAASVPLARPATAAPAPATPAAVTPAAVTPARTTAAVTPARTTAAVTPAAVAPSAPTAPTAATPGTVSIDLGGSLNKPSQSITIIVLLTLLTVAPALLMMLTSFTRIVIVLSLTRNALGLQSIPPNQVVIGLALFLSLFVMSPVLGQVNRDAVQPYLHAQKTQGQAYNSAVVPLRTWMLKQTRTAELTMFVKASGKKPAKPDDTPMAALVPAFILSELKTAFIIGFIVFIPFLVIDLIVSSSLMSMGMMMLPPVLVSLPFKILLFVLVDGWALVVHSLITSFH